MLHLFNQHKGWFYSIILTLLVCSVTTTITFDNHIADTVSIVVSILLSLLLAGAVITLLREQIEDICNP